MEVSKTLSSSVFCLESNSRPTSPMGGIFGCGRTKHGQLKKSLSNNDKILSTATYRRTDSNTSRRKKRSQRAGTQEFYSSLNNEDKGNVEKKGIFWKITAAIIPLCCIKRNWNCKNIGCKVKEPRYSYVWQCSVSDSSFDEIRTSKRWKIELPKSEARRK